MLKLVDVGVTLSGKPILDGLNLTVAPGELVTVIGSNGAGKSTLLNVIAGSVAVNKGTVLIGNADVTHWPSYKRAALVARVMQNPSVGTVGKLTVEENLSFAFLRGQRRNLALYARANRRALFREKLSELGMGLEASLQERAENLSGGQRQVLSLVMATLQGSQIVLLDEHTAALDPKTAARVMEMTIRIVREHRITTLMITHNMADVMQQGGRLLCLSEGKIVREVGEAQKRTLSTADLATMFSTF